MTQTEALTSVCEESFDCVENGRSAERGGGGGGGGGGGRINYEPLLLVIQKKDLPLHVVGTGYLHCFPKRQRPPAVSDHNC